MCFCANVFTDKDNSKVVIYLMFIVDFLFQLEVRAFLLTDMLLICKKLSKGANSQFKIIRYLFYLP